MPVYTPQAKYPTDKKHHSFKEVTRFQFAETEQFRFIELMINSQL